MLFRMRQTRIGASNFQTLTLRCIAVSYVVHMRTTHTHKQCAPSETIKHIKQLHVIKLVAQRAKVERRPSALLFLICDHGEELTADADAPTISVCFSQLYSKRYRPYPCSCSRS